MNKERLLLMACLTKEYEDIVMLALMKNVICSFRAAIKNPEDYVARRNLVWAGTMAENRIIKYTLVKVRHSVFQ